jgi:hypothetical protein
MQAELEDAADLLILGGEIADFLPESVWPRALVVRIGLVDVVAGL